MEKYSTDSNHFLTAAERGLRFPNRFPDGILEIGGRAAQTRRSAGDGGTDACAYTSFF